MEACEVFHPAWYGELCDANEVGFLDAINRLKFALVNYSNPQHWNACAHISVCPRNQIVKLNSAVLNLKGTPFT
jgi:hypothetical protein